MHVPAPKCAGEGGEEERGGGGWGEGVHQVGIGDVRPGGDVVDAVPVLPHHGVADVRKFAVLKDQEVCVNRGTHPSGGPHRSYTELRTA